MKSLWRWRRLGVSEWLLAGGAFELIRVPQYGPSEGMLEQIVNGLGIPALFFQDPVPDRLPKVCIGMPIVHYHQTLCSKRTCPDFLRNVSLQPSTMIHTNTNF